MSAPEVQIVDTGLANTASVIAALKRCGACPELCKSPVRLAEATQVVLPGVGAFGAGINRLRELGMESVIRERIDEGRPTLAICLGMQLLAGTSDESPNSTGLGVIGTHVGRFQAGVRTPQFGWNRVDAGSGCRLLTSGYAYFANSFRIVDVPEGWDAAVTDHGGEFISAIERGAVLACQFHPELSGPWGEALVGRWLATSREAITC